MSKMKRAKPISKKGTKRRSIPHAEPVPKKPVCSSTYYKAKANSKSYSFSVERKFVYRDMLPKLYKTAHNSEARFQVARRIIGLLQSAFTENALVLRDRKGTPRFVVGYSTGKDGALKIGAIQRMRTQYTRTRKSIHRFPEGVKYRWSSELETQASKKLQAKLNGMHPSEFILCEFLYRNRAKLKERINQGKPALRLWGGVMSSGSYGITPDDLRKIYNPLIERFFGKYNQEKFGWSLNPNKKRVKVILGL